MRFGSAEVSRLKQTSQYEEHAQGGELQNQDEARFGQLEHVAPTPVPKDAYWGTALLIVLCTLAALYLGG
jgi:hypothetical protein